MQFFLPDMSTAYAFLESTRSNFSPARLQLLLMQQHFLSLKPYIKKTNVYHVLKASLEISERLTRKYRKPEFAIESCIIDDKEYKIEQTIVREDVFCNIQHFKKANYRKKQEKLLIVAPMAGHHATLLRETVRDTLPFFDVYITDWIDANQVPISHGSFDLDSFIDYVINFIAHLGPELNVMAVCQPTVPVLAATALMSENNKSHPPKSIILIGGPVDVRANPTVPSDFVLDKKLEWLDRMLISTVPKSYPGYRRRVYPGFLQLAGFLALNLQKHVTSHIDLFKNIIVENSAKAQKQKIFYNEYLSVMDLTAEFYLQTVKEVFHEFSIAKNKFISRGRKVNLHAIEKTALMGIEGGKDNIAAVGQTKAALSLCKNIPNNKKAYYLQPDVGHYGVFSGSKFRDFIVPQIKDFVYRKK